MSSTKQPFSKQAKCPVIGRQVSLNGVRVTLSGVTTVASKNCSNVEACIQTYGTIESITGCLLHNLQG